MWVCPVCRKPLKRNEHNWTCENGHGFDIARKGYVNLLLSSSQGRHGDDKLMVSARSAFLNRGYYGFLQDGVTTAVSGLLPESGTLVDCGCGEGYYTAAIQSARPDAAVFGVDISKFALMAAASRDKKLHLSVASSADLPLADGFADVCLAMFSPVIPGEFARVLKDDGALVLALVGEDHLWELKQALYEHPYKNEVIAPELPGFRMVSETPVNGAAALSSSEEIRSLFQMTPYYYKTGREDQAKLDGLSSLTVSLSFLIRVYQKA